MNSSSARGEDEYGNGSGYDETMIISKTDNVYTMTLTSTTTTIDSSTDRKSRENRNPVDALLLAIVEKFNLDSLSVSVSDSSSTSSTSSSFVQPQHNFPVGAAAQFTFRANSDANTNANTDGLPGSDDFSPKEFKENVLRILSSHKLLCENLQIQNLRYTLPIEFVHPRNNPNSDGNAPQPHTMIFLPTDGYTLCHSDSLWDKVISASPCRDFRGVYSNVQSNLNQIDIVNRAAWITVQRMDAESGGSVVVEKGLRFGRIVNEGGTAVTLARLLGGRDRGDNNDRAVQQHCPLMRSSKIYMWAENKKFEHDLKRRGAMDMYADIRNSFEQKGGGDVAGTGTDSRFGIEKRVIRQDGLANRGTLQTRVYYQGSTSCDGTFGDVGDNSGVCSDHSIDASIVDVFPYHVISPIYHTLKISLVEGLGAGSELYAIDPLSQTANDDYKITHYTFDELNFNLTYEALSLNQILPRDSSLYIHLDYNPKFLQFERFPADPNRGFDIPPSFATFSNRLHADGESIFYTMTYSNALLIMPPVPDLSMPFNVISIACTFFALIIGTTMNLSIRKSRDQIKKQFEGKDANKELRLKDKFRERLRRLVNCFRKGTTKAQQGSHPNHKEKSE